MDAKLIFIKTPLGDEAVRQSSRIEQRNLRMVLVQVDGKLDVAELSAKIGNPRLVEGALLDLEEGGFIAPRSDQVLGRNEEKIKEKTVQPAAAISPFPTSEFSSFRKNSVAPPSMSSQFSSFGKPILPTTGQHSQPPSVSIRKHPPKRRPASLPDQARSFSGRRWLFGIPLGLLLLLSLIALIYPYNNFKPAIEAAGGRFLQVPFRVGTVGLTLWPRPALSLSDVKLGDSEEGVIELVRITSPFALLRSQPRTLSGVDILGAKISADFLLGMPLFQKSGPVSESGLLVRQMKLERLTVTVRDLALHNLSGQISFQSNGSIENANLRNDSEGIQLQAIPTTEGMLLDIQGGHWMPLGKELVFNSLQAKGLLQKGKLVIPKFNIAFLHGTLSGNWLLEWNNGGLSMAGTAALQRLDCRKITAALAPSLNLEGELGGNLRLHSSGRDWDSLWNNVDAHLDADIAHGVLHGTDIGEAMRGRVVRSGSTKFDRLRAGLNIDAQQVVGRDVQMTAGMMAASGQFVAGRQRPVEANLLVTMLTSVSTMRAPVRVTGELSNLLAVSSK